MATVVQINTYNGGSTGNIAKQINTVAESKNIKTFFFFGRFWKGKSLALNESRIDNFIDLSFHLFFARMFDAAGLGSIYATRRLILELKKIKPDIVHLHNIHGYYINFPILFKYLKQNNIKVVWTLHDCWAFTGHCAYFDLVECEKWKIHCKDCPARQDYPLSYIVDKSERNFELKRKYFNSLGENLILVPVSNWLRNQIKDSFLKNVNSLTIHNGIDLSKFCPKKQSLRKKFNIDNSVYVIMGCAAPWSKRKGYDDFLKLRQCLSEHYILIMVGLTEEQIKVLPKGIIGIQRTNSIDELADMYSMSNLFINMTYEDNYPTVNLEAIACGTPVITYNTGGSPEAITAEIGKVVTKGDVKGILEAIHILEKEDQIVIRNNCRKHAERYFDKKDCFQQYINLYNEILKK